jgi:hypothetical protein
MVEQEVNIRIKYTQRYRIKNNKSYISSLGVTIGDILNVKVLRRKDVRKPVSVC